MENDFTAYDKRVLYRTYDVTRMLRAGQNIWAMELGRGRYGLTAPTEWYWNMAPWHANPAVRAQLEVTYADGSQRTFITGASWQAADSPTTTDSIYGGERFDARKQSEGDLVWKQARVVSGPTGQLASDQVEPIAITERLKPVSLTQPQPGVWVFDFGRIFAGWLQLSASGERGSTVSLMQGEKLQPDGTVEPAAGLVDEQLQTDRYTFAGSGREEWQPSFSYKGFRYVQVQGLTEPATSRLLTGLVAHSELRNTGHFTSSNELLNQIQQAAFNSLSNNMHGLMSDTPTYEKNGWTGDLQASSLAAIYNFDVSHLWPKILDDAIDAQSSKGEVPEMVPTTPFYGYENTPGWDVLWGPTPSWDAFLFILPEALYAQKGDTQTLFRIYGAQRRLVEYTGQYINAANKFTYSHGLGEYAAVQPPMAMPKMPPKADGSAPTMAEMISYAMSHQPVGTAGPVDATAVAFYFYMVKQLAANEELLGQPSAAAAHRTLAEQIREAYNQRYWSASEKRYRSLDEHGAEREYSQTQNVLPVAFGMEPEGAAAAIMRGVDQDLIARHYHLTAGVYAIKSMLSLLSDYGYTDTAYKVVTQTTEPSWGWWIKNGLTTMLEGWALDSRSWDHHYFAEVSSWFYDSLAGIRPASPGYGTVRIAPHVPEGLASVSASMETPQGEVRSSWQRDAGGHLHFRVEVPGGTSATVELPPGAYTAEGIGSLRQLSMTDAGVAYSVGSGRFQFDSE